MLWSLLTRLVHIFVLVFIGEPSRHGENSSSERTVRTGYNSTSGGAVQANNNNDPKVIFSMSRARGILAHLINVILTPQQKKFAHVKDRNELEERKVQSQEQLDKISSLQQQLAAKEEELATMRNEVFNLHHQLGRQSDLLNDLMGNSVDEAEIMQHVLTDKDKTIDKLQGVIEMYKAELSSANELISHLKLEWSSAKQETDDWGEKEEEIMIVEEVADLNKRLITKQSKLEDITDMLKWYSMQYAHWEDKNQKLLNNLSILQQEILQKDEELVAIRNEMSMASGVLADKERSISKLQEDKEIYMAELNDANDLISQLKMKQLLMKQESVENEKKINKKFRVKDERLADLKDKLLAKQIVLDDLISTVKKYSKKYDNWQQKNKEQAGKISALQEEILLKEKELVAVRNDMKRLVNKQSYMVYRPTVVPLFDGGGSAQDDEKEMSNFQTEEVPSQVDNEGKEMETMKDQFIPEHHKEMQMWRADEEMYKDEPNDVSTSLTQALLSDGGTEHVQRLVSKLKWCLHKRKPIKNCLPN